MIAMRRFLCLLLLTLAACNSQPSVVVVPTLAVLPTETETPIPPPTIPPTATTAPSDTPLPTDTGTLPPTPTISLTPSDTPTEAPTELPTVTVTASLTITDTITPTISPTPTPTQELPMLGGLAVMAAQVTVLPPEIRYGTGTLTAMAQIRASTPGNILPGAGATPTAVLPGEPILVTLPPPPTISCQYLPPGNLNTWLAMDTTLQSALGCPVGAPPASVLLPGAWQPFERGFMVYVQGTPGSIYALSSDGRFRRYDDTFISGTDPESGGETPPSGLLEPIRGFGKVWRANLDARGLLGWATRSETGDTLTALIFERGQALYLPGQAQTFLLVNDASLPGSGTWRAFSGSF